jgi:hypothetical protein
MTSRREATGRSGFWTTLNYTDDPLTVPMAEFPYEGARSPDGVRQRARPQGVSSSWL